MIGVRDFTTQTDIPFLSIINRTIWSQHLQQMKFNLKQIVLLSDNFYSTMNSLSDNVMNKIFHIIENKNRTNILEKVPEQLDEINDKYQSFKTTLMALVKKYSNDRARMLEDLDDLLFSRNAYSSSTHDLNDIEMIQSGDEVKNDMKMIINVINFYDFDFNEDVAEHFHQILSFAVKTCRERSGLFNDDENNLPKILFSIKGLRFSSFTPNSGDVIEPTDSDRSLGKYDLGNSILSLDAKTKKYEYSDDTVLERERLNELGKRSQDMQKISQSMAALREKIKQNRLT